MNQPLCQCTSWKDCKYKKSGVGFAICRGTAIMPDGSVMSEERRQQYIARWEGKASPRSTPATGTRPQFVERCPFQGEEVRRVACESCRGAIQLKVFSCQVHGECTSGTKIDGVHRCDWRATQATLLKRLPVFVTASPRDVGVQVTSLRSIRDAGFGEIVVSCEPNTNIAELRAALPGLTFLERRERRGQWRHFIDVLRLGLDSRKPYFVTAEDDVLFCRSVGAFLASSRWPDRRCGCLQLYCGNRHGAHPRGRRSVLSPVESLDMLGCCALAFRADAARALIEWADEKGWRGEATYTIEPVEEKKASDTYVGEVLTFLGFTIWIHNPSIADHIGVESTLGHGMKKHRVALSFPGVNANLCDIFKDEPCIS